VELTKQHKKILQAMSRRRTKGYTRQELEHKTGIRCGTMCRRIYELINDFHLVKFAFKRKCQHSGEKVEALKIVI